ncbi:MAG: FAD-dependent oxidoreductase [candidate division NC10 bacterium]|nr:FAD-dependent oxidoreductase [candidate division NC10 bacterium]
MADGTSRSGFRVEIPDFAYWRRQIKCQDACPVHTDARGYVTAIADGDPEKAYVIAREPNPFASICGRVCAAPCEVACRRGDIDAPIAIRALKRFVTERYGVEAPLRADRDRPAVETTGLPLVGASQAVREIRNAEDATELRRLGRMPHPGRGKRVAVVGSGVAGLTCAHDLALLGYRVTVFEKQAAPGGMLMLGVPEYRLPRDLVRAEIQAVLALGVELRTTTAIGRDFALADLRAQGYEAVFLGIGCHKGRGLPIQGTDLDGVFRAVEFLLNINLGFKVDLGQRVIVVGGGDVAMDAARTAAREVAEAEVLTALDAARAALHQPQVDPVAAMREAMDVAREAVRTGAREVRVVCLESWEEMPAQRFEIEEALAEGLTIHPRLGPKRIVGRDGKVAGLETLQVRRVFDEQRRFSPQVIEGTEQVMAADSVILAIGQAADLEFLTPADGVEITPRGTIKVNPETLATTAPGIYAGGDVAFGPRIFIEGVANGHRAARSIHEYVSGQRLAASAEVTWVRLDHARQALLGPPVEGPRLPRVYPGYRAAGRREPPTLPIDRRIGIAEVELKFPDETAQAQARRCVRCGIHTIFDATQCILCGGCVDVCPEYCLRMVPVDQISGDDAVGTLIRAIPGVSFSPTPASRMAPATAMLMDPTRCIRCALCAIRCPTGAISMEAFRYAEAWVSV